MVRPFATPFWARTLGPSARSRPGNLPSGSRVTTPVPRGVYNDGLRLPGEVAAALGWVRWLGCDWKAIARDGRWLSPFRLSRGLADCPRPVERTDEEIVAAVRAGDTASFEELVRRYQPRVFASARRYARRESEVEDIVQEVFIKAFQKLDSFRGEAPFEHWLMRLTVRTCYDFLRQHQRNR